MAAIIGQTGRKFNADEAEGVSRRHRLALLRHGGYDLVLTDLAMPGLSGWEVAEAVRSESAVTPVILVTGSATDLDAQRADALGLTILHKPVPLEELQGAVGQALSSPGLSGP